jgi:hypothetical protein
MLGCLTHELNIRKGDQMGNATVEFKIEVMSDNTIKLMDAKNQALEEIGDATKLVGHLNKHIKDAIVTPMFTYLKTGSGVIIINGRAYYVP